LPGVDAPDRDGREALWFAFRGREVLVRDAGDAAEAIRPGELGAEPVRRLYLGLLGEVDCYAVELPADYEPAEGLAFSSLRASYGRLADADWALAGRAVQILDWDATHRFCGHCGAETQPVVGERSKECPACGLRAFPRLSPAVIVLVQRGEEMLLAHSAQWAEPVYSCIAGFVEPGESLEEAVEREVEEEVGIQIRDVRYHSSQPWPFPNSLMLGFTARYAGGEIRIDERELADAQWFSATRLPPELPGKLSIARRLVDSFLAAHGG